VEGHKITTKRESSTVTKAGKGFHQETNELPSLIGVRFEFTLGKSSGASTSCISSARKGRLDGIERVSAPGGTATFTAVKLGYSYVIPKHNLDTVVVKVSSVTKVQDVDYTIDTGSGELTVFAGWRDRGRR
jgi:hypothetical protein